MDQEVRAYLQKARLALKDADLLAAEGSPEATVNRTYYAMFYAATAMHLAEGRRFKKHASLIGQFNKVFVHQGNTDSKFYQFLQTAFDLRGVADYGAESATSVSRKQAQEMVRNAYEFVAMAEQFLKGAGGKVER